MSAAIAAAGGNAFRRGVVTGIFREAVATDATIRRDAVAVFAAAPADRLAAALVTRLVAAVARATFNAFVVSAGLGAKERAVAGRFLVAVTVLAGAHVRRAASCIDTFEIANWLADGYVRGIAGYLFVHRGTSEFCSYQLRLKDLS